MANRHGEQVCHKVVRGGDRTHVTFPEKKDDQKRLWKEWIEETSKGFKDVLRREGKKK